MHQDCKFQLRLRGCIGAANSFFEADLRLPSEGMDATYIEKLLRSAVLP